jgi:peptide/nickel transport system permease protein
MSGLVKDRHIESGAISIDCNWPCLGVSFKYRVSVFDYLWERFPATLSVAVGGAIFFLTIGLSSGIFAARRRGTPADKAVVGASLFISAPPYYLLALLSYLYLVQAWGIFPETGYFSPFTDGPAKWVSGMLLPWIMIGIVYSTQYARFSRGAMIDSLNEDYVRTARAKGASQFRVVRKHVLHNALIPVIAMLSMDMVVISFTGIVFVETVFQLPGLGRVLYQALTSADLPVILGISIVISFTVVIVNLIADILYCLIDPRMNLRGPTRRPVFSKFRMMRPQPTVTEAESSTT